MTQDPATGAAPDSISNADASRPWRLELIIGVVICATLIGAQLLVGWYNGRGLRPLLLAGLLFWVTTTFALGARRRRMKVQRPQSTLKPWRFSFLEMLALFTGLTLFIGFSIADYQASARVFREQSTFRSSVEPLLGLDGHVGFAADGSLTISVCDRSFDDARLVKLAQMIEDWNQNVSVTRFSFGTGAKTGGTPPVWPGVTDGSVDLLLKWDELEWLSVDGTSISAAGRKRLLTLPRLNDLSRSGLEK